MINPGTIEEFVNDLDQDEVEVLVRLVGSMNALEMVEGAPRFDGNEIDLITKFNAFVEANDEDDIEEDEEEDGDIPDTGEDVTPVFEFGVNHPLHEEATERHQ